MKEIYATKYHLITLSLASIFIIATFLINKTKLEILAGVILFLLAMFILAWLSYKGKIPLYRIK